MTKDLTAASRHQHLAFYDPAAIPETLALDPDLDAQDPEPPPMPSIRQLAAEGRALVIRIASEDCEARLRVLIDEELDPVVRRRGAVLVAGSRLRLPGGEIRADGIEFMCRPGQVRAQAEGSSASLPAGDYGLEVVELLNWKRRNAAGAVQESTTRLERIAHVLVLVYTWIGIVLFPGNIFGAPVAVSFAYSRSGWRGAALAVAVVLLIDAIIVGGFWVLRAAQRRFPALTRVRELQEALETRHPDVIVVLRSQAPASAAQPAFAEIVLAP